MMNPNPPNPNQFKPQAPRSNRVFLLFLFSLAVIPNEAFAQRGAAGAASKVIKVVGKYVSSNPGKVAGAAAALGGVAVAKDLFSKHMKTGEATYAILLNLDAKYISEWRGDLFGAPDLFVLVQVAGVGEYLVPTMVENYGGGKVIFTFKAPKFPPGRDVVVMLYDSDSTADAVWNGIFQTRAVVKVSEFNLYDAIKVKANVSGSIQLLNTQQVINGPDQLVTFAIKTPKDGFVFSAGNWESEGVLEGPTTGNRIGAITFSQVEEK